MAIIIQPLLFIYVMNRMRLVFSRHIERKCGFQMNRDAANSASGQKKEQVESRKKDRCRMRAFVGCGAFASGSKVDILCLGQ